MGHRPQLQLPFTLVVEPPTASELRGMLRKPLFWAALVMLLAGVFTAAALRGRARAAATAEAGALRVSSVPSHAFVDLDGHALGRTPATWPVSGGHHVLRVQGSGYAAPSYEVSVTPGETLDVQAALWLTSPHVLHLHPPLPGTAIVNTQFLADGRVVLTDALPSGNQQLWLIDAEGHSERVGPSQRLPHVALSLDGQRVAYATDSANSAGSDQRAVQVWVSTASGEGLGRKLFGLDGKSPGEQIADVTWSPNGQQLLVVVGSQGPGGKLSRFSG